MESITGIKKVLTIKEITDNRLYNKIKNIKENIDQRFEHSKSKISFHEKLFLSFIFIFIFTFAGMYFLPILMSFILPKVVSFYLSGFIGITAFITLIFLSYKHSNSKENKNYKKLINKVKLYNIQKEKDNQNKKIKATSMLKFIKKLNKKEIYLIEKINELEIYNQNNDKIIFEILYDKIKNSSIEEIEIEKSYILNYIEKNKNNKYGLSIEFIFKKNIKEEKRVTSNIINMI